MDEPQVFICALESGIPFDCDDFSLRSFARSYDLGFMIDLHLGDSICSVNPPASRRDTLIGS